MGEAKVEPPYRVELHPLGYGPTPPIRSVKVRPRGVSGEMLTEDEQGVWAYVEYLERQVSRLRGDLEEVEGNAAEPEAATEGDPAPKKRKGGK